MAWTRCTYPAVRLVQLFANGRDSLRVRDDLTGVRRRWALLTLILCDTVCVPSRAQIRPWLLPHGSRLATRMEMEAATPGLLLPRETSLTVSFFSSTLLFPFLSSRHPSSRISPSRAFLHMVV